MDITDTQIDRAVTLLGFMDGPEAAGVMVASGVSSEEAFFAVKAAEILVAPFPYTPSQMDAMNALADLGEVSYAEWVAQDEAQDAQYVQDDGDYLDRKYTGAVFA